MGQEHKEELHALEEEPAGDHLHPEQEPGHWRPEEGLLREEDHVPNQN